MSDPTGEDHIEEPTDEELHDAARPQEPEPEDRESEETHRGGFGEFGGETSSFIERSFRERIILVGVSFPPHDLDAVDASLDELAQLVDTAGADVVGRIVQRRDTTRAYVGSGKSRVANRRGDDCDTVVFDDELTPAQQFNLEKALGGLPSTARRSSPTSSPRRAQPEARLRCSWRCSGLPGCVARAALSRRAASAPDVAPVRPSSRSTGAASPG